MAGSNNVLQWNPTQANQETDSQYVTDAQRTGGATDPSPFPSSLANKAFYQWSTFLKAFGDALANKGYVISDADVVALTAVLAHIRTDSDVIPDLVQQTWGTTMTFDASVANGWEFTLGGNTTSSAIVNYKVGQIVRFIIHTGAGGSTFSWPPHIINAGSVDLQNHAICIQEFIGCNDNYLRPLGGMILSF
jgi:hypothetical protein